MSELSAEQDAAIEADLRRYRAAPMPPELREQIENLIEPHTMASETEHSAVMECIRVAWPAIRDWLRDHPGDMAAPPG
jgi:hypothetical protein